MGTAGGPVRNDALPDVAGAREVDRDDGQNCGEDDDRKKGEGLGRGQGLQLLHPTERRYPDQSVQAQSRVGDHPDGVRNTEERRGIGGSLASGRTELAGEGTDRQEHDGGRHDGQREIQDRTRRRGSPSSRGRTEP